MTHLKQALRALLFSCCTAIGTAQAVPLATFDTAHASNYVDFPIDDEDDRAIPPFQVSGVLALVRPNTDVFALDTHYIYDHSLIAYFDFLYGLRVTDAAGQVITVDGLSFHMLFDSPDDYIELGRIPAPGSSITQTFAAQDIVDEFKSQFHGLWDNDWFITGFEASVRHVYMPAPEPATLLLVGIAVAALAGLRPRSTATSGRIAQPLA